MPDVKISPATIVIALAGILILGAFGWLTFGPKPVPQPPPVLTAEAKEYLPNLGLEQVHMQESESMTDQRVVEILGNIVNHGTRNVKLAEVTCIFRDFSNREMKRERVPIVLGLAPGQSKPFRLPFDDVARTWNTGLPSLVIAQIQFE